MSPANPLFILLALAFVLYTWWSDEHGPTQGGPPG